MTRTELHSKPRRLSQTYLVFPEWFIVYATDDLGKVCKYSCASDFPYFVSIFQFWYVYLKVSLLTRKLPFNFQYHGMLIVIGISFSVEMLAKGFYETTIGQISWLTNKCRPTPEDTFLAKMTEEYATFMHTVPWYKFDFAKRLEQLNNIPKGRSFRHFERRLFIKTDLWLKTRYARLIGKGIQAPDDKKLEAIIMAPSGQLSLATMPRYQNFDDTAMRYADTYRFIEIAGNKVICLSVLSLKNTQLPGCIKRLYSIGWLPNQAFERVVVELPVTDLAYFLNFLKQNRHITLEKIYDY